MTKKVNFLEKGAFGLTYRRLVTGIILWALFCFFLVLMGSGYNWFLGKKVHKQQTYLAQLNVMKDRTMALVEASKVEIVTSNVKALNDIFANFPLWSNVMDSLSRSMPPQLWLTTIVTEYLSGDSLLRKIEMGGIARSTSSIARFLQQLNDQSLFHNMVLNQSSRITEEGKKQGYSFVVLGEVRFGEKKWN